MAGWKKRLTRALASAAERGGLLHLLQRAGKHTGRSLYVLAYHRVGEAGPADGLDPALVNTTPAQFQEQMALVAACYRPVTLEQVLEAAAGGRPPPRDAVLVTVDDGYRDFKETILPICARFNITPLLFVPTGFVGKGDFWWDKLYRLAFQSRLASLALPGGQPLPLATPGERLEAHRQATRFLKETPHRPARAWLDTLYREAFGDQAKPDRSTLDWDELRALAKQAIPLCAHTVTHPLLGNIPLDEARAELRDSRAAIRTETGADWPCAAYPDGMEDSYNEAILGAAREEGFQIAFTMREGRADMDIDSPLGLPRMGGWSRMALAGFHARLTPAYAAYRRRFPEA